VPPTYSPWWRPFEALARFTSAKTPVDNGDLAVGDTQGTDCQRDFRWRNYVEPAALFDLWGPPQSSPWSGYHRPTLFAALDAVKRLGPAEPSGLTPADAPQGNPSWADERTAILLDLPGEVSVAYAAWLARDGSHEPVASFNNWPHSRAVVPAHHALAAMLYYAPWLEEARARRDPKGRHPPVVMLDARRVGERAARPTEFDNRYFLLESDLPSGPVLRRHGVERVVYVARERRDADDLNGYLHELSRFVRVEMAEASTSSWSVGMPTPFAVALRKTPYSTATDPAFRGFRRNRVGGFGVLVPEPSSGGSG
jgi:hypothetical protein